jgi:YD repeat-containing protein
MSPSYRRIAKRLSALLLALCGLASANFEHNRDGTERITALTDPLGNSTHWGAPRGSRAGQGDRVERGQIDEVYWRSPHPAPGSHPRIAALAGPLLRPSQSRYNAVGDLVSVTDAQNRVTRYTWDANHRRTQTTCPDGGKWDASGENGENGTLPVSTLCRPV